MVSAPFTMPPCMQDTETQIPAPNAFLIAMEFRAPWELWSILPCWPALAQAPAGDGHPVIVLPGLSASDGSTLPLRGYLGNLGYDVSGWNQGHNFGPRAGILDTAKRQIFDTCAASGQPVSLIGWSLGGIYARELAKDLPDCVRSVITLGTPFAGSHKSTNAWWAIADRLAQPLGQSKPFERNSHLMRMVYPDPGH